MKKKIVFPVFTFRTGYPLTKEGIERIAQIAWEYDAVGMTLQFREKGKKSTKTVETDYMKVKIQFI